MNIVEKKKTQCPICGVWEISVRDHIKALMEDEG